MNHCIRRRIARGVALESDAKLEEAVVQAKRTGELLETGQQRPLERHHLEPVAG